MNAVEERKARLLGIEKACLEHHPRSRAALVRSIRFSFICTQETAVSYVTALFDGDRLMWRGGCIVPGPRSRFHPDQDNEDEDAQGGGVGGA